MVRSVHFYKLNATFLFQLNIIPKPHKLKEKDWQERAGEELGKKVPARPVRTSLADPVNRHSRVLKLLLDDLISQVKRKMERVRSKKRIKFMGIQNSVEFLSRLEGLKVTEKTLLITSDFR